MNKLGLDIPEPQRNYISVGWWMSIQYTQEIINLITGEMEEPVRFYMIFLVNIESMDW